MRLSDYGKSRAAAEEQRLAELEAAHSEELAALIEEIYNEDLEVIDNV